jgi:hypothetical protein
MHCTTAIVDAEENSRGSHICPDAGVASSTGSHRPCYRSHGRSFSRRVAGNAVAVYAIGGPRTQGQVPQRSQEEADSVYSLTRSPNLDELEVRSNGRAVVVDVRCSMIATSLAPQSEFTI